MASEQSLTRSTYQSGIDDVPKNPVLLHGTDATARKVLTTLVGAHPEFALAREFHPPDLLSNPSIKISYHHLLEFAYLCRNLEDGPLRNVLEERHWSDLANYLDRCGCPAKEFGLDLAAYLRSVGKISSRERALQFLGCCANRARKAAGVSRWAAECRADFDTYAKAWPQARFVHAVRDGRDALADQNALPGPKTPAASFAMAWVAAHASVQRHRETLGNTVLVVRYEDFADDPDGAVAMLCDALQVPRHPAMTNALKSEAFPRGRWKSELSQDEAAAFLDHARPLLESLGYET